MSIEFWQTIMGRTFVEGTMPRIAHALEKIGTALTKPTEQQPDQKVLIQSLWTFIQMMVSVDEDSPKTQQEHYELLKTQVAAALGMSVVDLDKLIQP